MWLVEDQCMSLPLVTQIVQLLRNLSWLRWFHVQAELNCVWTFDKVRDKKWFRIGNEYVCMRNIHCGKTNVDVFVSVRQVVQTRPQRRRKRSPSRRHHVLLPPRPVLRMRRRWVICAPIVCCWSAAAQFITILGLSYYKMFSIDAYFSYINFRQLIVMKQGHFFMVLHGNICPDHWPKKG